jgi:hypothetical protein
MDRAESFPYCKRDTGTDDRECEEVVSAGSYGLTAFTTK